MRKDKRDHVRRLPGGFFSLERRLLEEDMAGDMPLFCIWGLLIGWANVKDGKTKLNGQQVIVKRGQLVTGQQQLSDYWGLTRDVTRRCLDYLESTGRITQQKTQRGTIITICKYDYYQSDRRANHHLNPQRSPNEAPTKPHIRTREQEEQLRQTTSPSVADQNDVVQDTPIGPTPEQLAEVWNAECQGGMVRVSKTKPGTRRWDLAAALLRGNSDLEYWRGLIRRAARSPFCRGEVKTWAATFEWFCAPDTEAKISEGQYDDKKPKGRRLALAPKCGVCHDTGRLGATNGIRISEFSCPHCEAGKADRGQVWCEALAAVGWQLDSDSETTREN